ncbi:helix-turn-helix domain-containing protein [Streptomyces alkaliterrae]|uniref:LuxR family transcriptional regulator n=1 Tax=Streptomyces alkaliterrae TaxID=2213162 RepID=A0A7W3WXQ9_9ACTN|nr:LuxR family transcriptional regulator [Streptomyces alkaliterrae]MBB1260468.1 LuxR family transcriptional regulator [Streptomyces alkaliterrae]
MGQVAHDGADDPHSAELAGHLAALGVDREAVGLYLDLLSGIEPAGTGAEREPAVYSVRRAEAVGRLVELGLVVENPEGPARPPLPVPPGAALDLLSRRATLRLEEATAAIAGAYERYRRRDPAASGGVVAEEVTGDDIERRLGEALGSARKEVLRFDTPPYFWSSARGADSEIAMLQRGVQVRAVYARASLAHPGHLTTNIQPCVDAGEQARVLPELPVKLTIIDDRVGFVSLSIADVDISGSLLVVRPSGLLTALRALFEACWERALPIQSVTGSSPASAALSVRPGPTERRILAMLVAGVPDSQIIRELGVSRRTFFRRMELLMAQAGAASRFQLALQAQRRGWL